MRLEVGGASVLGGVPLFPCHCIISPLPLPLLGSLLSLSPFHPQSTPRAVARRAGGGWCIVICRTSFVHCLVSFVCHRPLSVVRCLSYVVRSSSSVVCHMSFVCRHQSSVDWRPSSLPICPASSGLQRQG
jgi:hypothetical protein